MLLSCNTGRQEPPELTRRWFFVDKGLAYDATVDTLRGLIRTAAAHGLNGMVLDAGFDKITRKSAEYRQRLTAVKQACEQNGVELIPCLFSVGYGAGLLSHDRNLAAGARVTGALFTVRDRIASFRADPEVPFSNGGIERFEGKRIKGFWLQDRPGRVSFIDSTVVHGGRYAVRFQDFHKSYKGHGRIMQELEVEPHRTYRVTAWVKTDTLMPRECFKILVLRRDRGDLAPCRFRVPPTTRGWQKVSLVFNSFGNTQVRIYTGVWGAESGQVWLDDLSVREIGPLNVLNRPGTPVTVTGKTNRVRYEPGRDYYPLTDPLIDYTFCRPEPGIRLTPDSRIADGESLLVSYYQALKVRFKQVPACMSEPKLYEIMEAQARRVDSLCAPRHYFLSMDEVRAGGGCRACRDGDRTMARILGECITRQHGILKKINPQAEVVIWSDMLDPLHNAVKDYYLVQGDYYGSWEYIPEDLVIMDWNVAEKKKSLRHFKKNGFATMASVSFRRADPRSTRAWLKALRRTPGSKGIMYTTWTDYYGFLGGFGDMVMRADAR